MLGPDKLVIGGHFGQYDGAKRTGLALINLSDGSIDTTSWNPAPDLTAVNFVSVWETFVDEETNHIYVGGTYQTVAGADAPQLHALYLHSLIWEHSGKGTAKVAVPFPATVQPATLRGGIRLPICGVDPGTGD